MGWYDPPHVDDGRDKQILHSITDIQFDCLRALWLTRNCIESVEVLLQMHLPQLEILDLSSDAHSQVTTV